jgi:hypothetical protein
MQQFKINEEALKKFRKKWLKEIIKHASWLFLILIVSILYTMYIKLVGL